MIVCNHVMAGSGKVTRNDTTDKSTRSGHQDSHQKSYSRFQRLEI